MQKIRLEQVYINGEKQDGTQFVNKKGNPFKMCNIVFDGGRKASMYIGQWNGSWDKKLDIVSQWQPNQEVTVVLEESGEYLNFNVPNETQKELASIKFRLARIEGKLGLNSPEATQTPVTPQKPTTAQNLASQGMSVEEPPLPEPTGTVVEGDPGYIDVSQIPF